MDRRIRQPPHSAGQSYKGLRSRIDPEQIPSPITAAGEDQALWSGESYMTCTSHQPVPLSGSDYHAIDQGNSTPRFLRLTTYAIPYSSDLASACDVPLGAVIQPFADQQPEEESIPLVDFGDTGPPRCSQPWCRAYINPWCVFVNGGAKWQCNFCGAETEVSSEYFSGLDSDLRRLDHLQRPELNKGTVDFAVPEEYWAPQPDPRLFPSYHTPLPRSSANRPPQPMRYVFAIDVSFEAVQSGIVESACAGLLDVLYGSQNEGGNTGDTNNSRTCFPPGNQIAIITFDRTLHFYTLSPTLQHASLLVVPDIDDVFVPLREELWAYPEESRTVIEDLLRSIPRRFADTVVYGAALGSVLRASLASLAGRGGQVACFQSAMPTFGAGALPPREQEESTLYGTDKEKALFVPRNPVWRDLGEECAEEGVGITLFLAPGQPTDIGSLGIVSSLTGGEIFFHPRYNRSLDEEAFISQLRRFVSRETAYNCTMRVRCSKGLRVSQYYGNFHQRSSTDLDLGTCDADKAVCVLFEHSGIQLDERTNAYLQAAMLYTSASGSRRLRTCNIAISVSSLAGNVFRHSDQETVVTCWAKQAVASMTSRSLKDIRESLTEKCATVLLAYRRNCAASSAPSQLILPEQFKLLPLYTLTVLKSRALKGRNVVSDVRNFHAHRISSFNVAAAMQYLYPRLLALHDLTDDICFPDPTTGRIQLPALMRDSYAWMENNGIYLADNGEMMILWFGASVSPQLLKDLYEVENLHELKPSNSRLPNVSSRISTQIRHVLTHRERQRGGRKPRFLLARQDLDAAEIDFSDMLAEDQNNDAMSYVDYLMFVHKQINTALTGGTSIIATGSSNKTPW